MRTSRLICAIALVSLAIGIACQKVKYVPAPASITVVHAMFNSSGAIVPKFGSDTAGRYYIGPTGGNTMVRVGYGASQLYSRVAGTTPLSVVPFTDTTFKIFNGSINLESGGIYTFFLSGDTAHADTTLVEDHIPYYADSSAGVRFINLTVGGKGITINLSSDSTLTPIATLGYRQITDFKKYAATLGVGGSYSFDIRDQATGDLLTPVSWNYSRFKNNTIVIAGDPNVSTDIFTINNY
jgi:hypothetical protein